MLMFNRHSLNSLHPHIILRQFNSPGCEGGLDVGITPLPMTATPCQRFFGLCIIVTRHAEEQCPATCLRLWHKTGFSTLGQMFSSDSLKLLNIFSRMYLSALHG